jgi:hypothetical protein
MKELHDGPVSGHFVGDTTAHKILRVVYYWPKLFKGAHTYARNYKTYQISTGREKRVEVPLQPVTVSRPFEQWGLGIIGEIAPRYSKKHKYILTTIDYFAKWEEAIPLVITYNCQGKQVIQVCGLHRKRLSAVCRASHFRLKIQIDRLNFVSGGDSRSIPY